MDELLLVLAQKGPVPCVVTASCALVAVPEKGGKRKKRLRGFNAVVVDDDDDDNDDDDGDDDDVYIVTLRNFFKQFVDFICL